MSVQVDCSPCQLQKRKLELCRSFTESGFCPYGANCFFAHGLQQLQQHQPTLRTRMCRNFHVSHFCKFGSRCNFLHDQPATQRRNFMTKMMTNYPQLLPSLSFKKKFLTFL